MTKQIKNSHRTDSASRSKSGQASTETRKTKRRTKKQVVAAFVERVSEIDFDRGFALVRIAPNRWRIVASKEEGEPEPIYKMTKDLTTLKFVDGQWVEVSRISDAPFTSTV